LFNEELFIKLTFGGLSEDGKIILK